MGAAEQWMSLRAYARRRGVELSAVQKAISSGRVTAVRRSESGRLKAIEANAADAQWLANTDPVESARTTSTLAESAEQLTLRAPGGERPGESALPAGEPAGAADVAAGGAAENNGKDQFGYLEARAKREQFQAKQAELDYLAAIGELVPMADLRQAASRRYRGVRDKLLNIPDRLATILAAEKDPAVVHAALSKEIKQVLHELSDDARAEVARGRNDDEPEGGATPAAAAVAPGTAERVAA